MRDIIEGVFETSMLLDKIRIFMKNNCNCGNGGPAFHVALALVVIGAINWGLVGAFNFDLVSAIFGDGGVLTRIIFVLVGISGLWSIKLFKGCRGSKGASSDMSHSNDMSHESSHEPMGGHDDRNDGDDM